MWGYGPYGLMGYSNGWGDGEWMMIFSGIFWLILLALAVAAVVWIMRTSSHGPHYLLHAGGRSSGLDILEERYARGEINREEYLQKKRDILGRGAAA